MKTIDKIQGPIEEEMRNFEPHYKKSMDSPVPLLSTITNYIYRRKGKQLRPMLVFLSSKLVGETKDSTYVGASLIELLHTATLVHDDVVDEAYQRRGFFSINALWKSKVAVLVGDFFLAKGLMLAMDANETELLRIVTNAVKEISEGELLQIQKSRKLDITEEEYFEIIRKKTATLIAACTALGAKSVGANEENINKMYEFGEKLGIAFQMRDDIFDYESSSKIGKPTGNDIKEKKLTLPLIYSLRETEPTKRRRILRLINKHHNNKQKVDEVIRFVHDHGGIDYTRQLMKRYKEDAKKILKSFPDNDAKEALMELVEYTVNRKK